MKRLLFVAYYFPPLGGIGSIRALKCATYLPRFGWDVTVLSPQNGAFHRDESLEFPREAVLRTRSLELSRMGKRAIGAKGGDAVAAEVGPMLSRFRDAVRSYLYRPDAQIGWYPFALATGAKALRTRHFDAILSSSFPITTHLVARRLSHWFRLPWIAEFRDPWTDTMAPATAGRERSVKLEHELVTTADGVVVPSQGWADLFTQKGARAVATITNGYDPIDYDLTLPPESWTLTHAGSFHPDRQDLTTLFDALKRIRFGAAPLPIRLKFVGDLHPRLKDQLGTRGLAERVEVTGFLPYRKALATMAASSVLLVSGASDERPILRGMIPAKIFEYLGAQRPIVYVGDPRAEPAKLLLEQPDCYVVPPGDVDGAELALRNAFASANSSDARAPRQLARFGREALNGELGLFLDTIVSGHASR